MGARLAAGTLLILVGTPGSGKSTWAAGVGDDVVVVSSDELCALLGAGRRDQRARGDALALLDTVVARRLRAGLTTVVDATSLEDDRRAGYRAAAGAAGRPCVAVAFPTPAAVCRTRNRARPDPVPEAAMAALTKRAAAVLPGLELEGFDGVIDATAVAPGALRIVPPALVDAPAVAARQRRDPTPLRVGLHLSRFDHHGGSAGLRNAVVAAAQVAEASGFSSLWVMDHLLQVPQVGREWEDLPDGWTMIAALATVTSSIRLGVLVTDVTLRPLVHLANVVAAADCLSGGRITCGLGLGWFARERAALGVPLPPVAERYEVLEDALELLPLLWGKGSPPFVGRTVTVPETIAYPRPVQDPVPLLIGGGGERRTLRLVAQHADACNLQGGAASVARKLDVLRAHCADVGRDPSEIAATQLTPVTVWSGTGTRPDDRAMTTEELIAHCRTLADVGVDEVILAPGTLSTEAVRTLADVAAAFR